MSANHSEDYYLKILFEKTKIREIMLTGVETLQVQDKPSRALKLFNQTRLSHLAILNAEQEVIGLLTPKYLYKTQSPRKFSAFEETNPVLGTIVDGDSFYTTETLDSYFLKNIMRKDPPTLREDDDLSSALKLMYEKNLGCIPIVDQATKFKGLLTNKEIVSFIAHVVVE